MRLGPSKAANTVFTARITYLCWPTFDREVLVSACHGITLLKVE